jgi:hypothetical protein
MARTSELQFILACACIYKKIDGNQATIGRETPLSSYIVQYMLEV